MLTLRLVEQSISSEKLQRSQKVAEEIITIQFGQILQDMSKSSGEKY